MEEHSCHKCGDSDEKIKNYERRLAIVIQEKNLAVEMFQAGAQRIEQLEQELNCSDDKKKFELFKRQVKEVHIQMQSDYSDAIEMLERKLASVSSDLELESRKVNQKEAELAELQNKIATLKFERESWRDLESRERNLQEKCLELESKCMEYENIIKSVRPAQVLDEEVERLRKQLSSVERQRNEMQIALEETQKSAEHLASDELAARHKVCEAISLVETTLHEKQQIQNQLMLTENECRRLQKELMGLIEEAGKKVKKEVEAVKRNYQEKLERAQSQISVLEVEKNKKIFQLEKHQQEITRLEGELEEQKRKSVSQRKLQAVSEELFACQAQLELLHTENKSLNELIMQNQHRYESEMSKCGIERRFLEKQILKLQTNLGETGHNLERAVEHCHQLSDHLNKLSNDLVTERAANESDSTELMKQLRITKIQSNSAIEELKKFVNAHNSISSQWKNECNEITTKFSDRMKELKMENKKEKKRSKKLLKKLTASQAYKGVNVLHGDGSSSDDLKIAAIDLNKRLLKDAREPDSVAQNDHQT